MEIKRVVALYWSATGNTRMVTETIGKKLAESLEVSFERYNFTRPEIRLKEVEFDKNDVVVIGSPTYAGKLPNKILPDFRSKLKGNGAMAVALVTFGNRSYDNSLAELTEVLTSNDFYVISGAAMVGRHAFTDQLAFGHPKNEKDLKEAEQFALQSATLIQKAEAKQLTLHVPGDALASYYVPKGINGQPVKFLKAKPKTDKSKCTGCKACAHFCPMNAIDLEDVSNVPGICIKCQSCVRICSTGAKYFDDEAFLSHVAMLEQNFKELKNNEFYYAK